MPHFFTFVQSPRAATVVAASKVTLFRVDQITFRCILQNQTRQSVLVKNELLQKLPFLKGVALSDVETLANVMTPRVFSKGETLVTKGEIGDAFYLIQEGNVLCKDISVGDKIHPDTTLGPGEYFGERALIMDEPRAANVVALTEGIAFRIDRETFEAVLGTMAELTRQAQDGELLSRIKPIEKSGLDGRQLSMLSKLMTFTTYDTLDKIMVKGQKTKPLLYLLRRGKVELEYEDGTVHEVEEGEHFGEETFKNDSRFKTASVIAPYTVTVLECCACSVLSYTDAEPIIEIHRRQQEKHASGYYRSGPSMLELTEEESNWMQIETEAELDDLKKHQILGEGTFGQVWLVSEELFDGSRQPYSLKIQSKHELANEGQINAVISEKNIMMTMNHPFTSKLVKTFQDKDFVYMLLEFIPGGELFSVINASETYSLSEDHAKFYSLCIADALAYLHSGKYIFRDLKPENVMIDKQGYPILIDFGFAKYVPEKTYTLCGTFSYLAPEVILTRGHDKAADNWTLGILIYVLLTGENPFYFDGMDQMSLFEAICQSNFEPPANVSPEAVDLVTRLLVKDPSTRLGSLKRGDRDIWKHKWFDELDLRAMRIRELPAPWVPAVKDLFDTSCFDDYSHLDDKTSIEYGPLDEKSAKLFKEF